MRTLKKTLLAGALACGALFASPAAAQIKYNGVEYGAGSTLALTFNGMSGTNAVTGLGSYLTLTYNGVNTTGDYLFDFTIKNTSEGHNASKVTAFGFDTSPAPLLSASSEDSLYSKISSGSIANGYNVLFCLTGGKGKNDSNCSGGSNIGVAAGETWKGSFVLGFAGTTSPGPVSFTNFHTRYQSTSSNGGSATGNLTQFADMTPKLVSPVPEADVWAMMIVGFGAVGFQVRRRGQRLKLRAA